MNREDIIRMAQDAGFSGTASEFYMQTLERFADLVASAEREAIAKWLEDEKDAPYWAELVRARGQA